MARRPDSEKHEQLSQNDLEELRYNLAHLSVDAVRHFYQRAHEDCRMVYDRLPSPKQVTDAGHDLEATVEVAVETPVGLGAGERERDHKYP